MSTAASICRPVNVHLRPDLVSVAVPMVGAQTWMVKDPLTLEHHQFTTEEYFILDCLRRPASLAQLRRQFESRFAPQRISHETLWAFLSRLHRAGLLVSNSAGQGDELLARMRSDRWRQWSRAWMQVLAIRFRGVDPDAWLTTFHKRFHWVFSSWTLAAVALVVFYAALLVVGHWAEFRARLPELSALADLRNVAWLMLALAIAKVLHELGHALVCKHFGGEVHELGLMLLAFTPCLYCDVSDAWQMPRRAHRILISAAGILVELLLASLAVIVWWYSQPGVVNLIALNIAVVCTVSTLVLNGNPLLRYDGYYILSDLVQTPNLWHRSRQVLREFAARWLAGLRVTPDTVTPERHRGWLAAYAVASKVYLAFVLLSIIWLLVQVLAPLRLPNVAYGLGMLAVGTTLAGPAMHTIGFLRNPVRRKEIRRGRIVLAAAGLIAAAAIVLAVPVPYRVSAPLVLMPRNAEAVYATGAGRLVEATPAGTHIPAGDPIARLENAEIAHELLRLEGERELQSQRLEHFEAMQGRDPEAAAQVPAAHATLRSIETQLEDRRRDADRLALSAPIDGTILRPPAHQSDPAGQGRLATWSGCLLDEENVGAWVEPGTLVCWVGDPAQLDAVLFVSDADAARVHPDQHVRLTVDAFPGKVLHGTVMEVAGSDAESARADRPVPGPVDKLSQGIFPPGRDTPRFQVRVRLHAPPPDLLIGTHGRAKITTAPMPLGRRLARYIARTFRVPL